ncbi:unnamed protein product [Moneuplotes crassus]|uniref:Uncharacterized protein n=1 Tax=Euplotes crassus TaxID=5936 RepID=A0AAD1UIP9_EUPCR|nr:unnamed protein product [Moneuplotes crassus]
MSSDNLKFPKMVKYSTKLNKKGNLAHTHRRNKTIEEPNLASHYLQRRMDALKRNNNDLNSLIKDLSDPARAGNSYRLHNTLQKDKVDFGSKERENSLQQINPDHTPRYKSHLDKSQKVKKLDKKTKKKIQRNRKNLNQHFNVQKVKPRDLNNSYQPLEQNRSARVSPAPRKELTPINCDYNYDTAEPGENFKDVKKVFGHKHSEIFDTSKEIEATPELKKHKNLSIDKKKKTQNYSLSITKRRKLEGSIGSSEANSQSKLPQIHKSLARNQFENQIPSLLNKNLSKNDLNTGTRETRNLPLESESSRINLKTYNTGEGQIQPTLTQTASSDNFSNDKISAIQESTRALRRKIRNLDFELDSKQIELEKDFQSLKNQKVEKDGDFVDLKFSIFKKILNFYNKCLKEINEKLSPQCQVRYNFIKRLEEAYFELFTKLKNFHVNEMTKYTARITLLSQKNKLYEKLLQTYKDKEGFVHTDIIGMKNKLDSVEKEMGISDIFKNSSDQDSNLLKILTKKKNEINQEISREETVNGLQEIFSAMVSMKGSGELLNTLTSKDFDFDVENWEDSMLEALKNAQFGAAKSVVGVIKNRDKFSEIEVQTEEDPLKDEFTALTQKFTLLQEDFKIQKEALEYANKNSSQRRTILEEAKKEWKAKELEYKQFETQRKELETRIQKSKEYELEFYRKIAKLTGEVDQKDKQIFEAEVRFNRKIKHMESDEYVIKRLERCIRDTRDGKSKINKNNPLYEAFMKMNLGNAAREGAGQFLGDPDGESDDDEGRYSRDGLVSRSKLKKMKQKGRNSSNFEIGKHKDRSSKSSSVNESKEGNRNRGRDAEYDDFSSDRKSKFSKNKNKFDNSSDSEYNKKTRTNRKGEKIRRRENGRRSGEDEIKEINDKKSKTGESKRSSKRKSKFLQDRQRVSQEIDVNNFETLDSTSDPESLRTYSVFESVTEEYETEDSQGNIVVKKRKTKVKKYYKTVDGKLVQKVKGKRRIKKRRKDSQGNSVEYSSDESYTIENCSVDEEKVEMINKKVREKVKEENKRKKEQAMISARIKRRPNGDFEYFSGDEGGFEQYQEEMVKKFGANGNEKGSFQIRLDRKIHSSSQGTKYFYDPKTGRKVRIDDSYWAPEEREKSEFQFADNPIPHTGDCGPNCSHMLKASMFRKHNNRKVLHMKTSNINGFGG